MAKFFTVGVSQGYKYEPIIWKIWEKVAKNIYSFIYDIYIFDILHVLTKVRASVPDSFRLLCDFLMTCYLLRLV
jgi:hypothetical protein